LLAVAALWAALITRVASPGPILFRQERIGLNGRRFHLYKFRTMHVSASVSAHQAHFAQLMRSNTPMQKLDARGDRRLIPGGWWLRATGLDELPQIINVLRGDMSVVGPRPCIPYEYEEYSAAQRERLRSMPGLTGLWQVSGKNRTTFEEMIRLDIAYGARKSLVSDLSIIIRTVPAVLTQVADTRRARRTAARPAVPIETNAHAAASLQPAYSATFQDKSQNVIVNTPENQPRVTARPFAGTA
jgi:lipopolysaccharide/colanic/teichoic acid biosynthesis glycosyltransferase